MADVIMPQMGESIAEGTITKWMKKVGDRVQRDEPLFEISTDKVDAEIPAPASGVLREIRVDAGATVPINTVVGVIGEAESAAASPGAAAPAPPAAASPAPAAAPPPAQAAAPAPAPAPAPTPAAAPAPSAPAAAAPAAAAPPAAAPPASAAPSSPARPATPSSPSPSALPGPSTNTYAPYVPAGRPSSPAGSPPASGPSTPSGATVPVMNVPPAPAPRPQPAAAPTPAPTPMPPFAEKPRADMTADELRQTRSSPVVRKIAAEHNVDIRQVPGTGIAGRVTKQDILGHIEGRPAGAPPPAAPTPAAPPTPSAPSAAPTTPVERPTPPAPAAPPPAAAPSASAPPPSPPASAAAAPSRPAPAPATPTPAPAPAAAPPATGAFAPFVPAYLPGERVEVVPMSPIRRKTAEHMVTSKRISAHVTTVFELEMTRVDQLRQKYRPQYEEKSGVKLTYMPFILKAVVDALKAFPVLNASVEGDAIVYKKDINIGIAVALDWGLIVPVLRSADEKNLLGLARAVNDLAERARTKRLKVDEVQGGTFTVTNPGVFGSLFGTPIINQPQVAILGVGTIEKRPVVRDDAIAIRTMAYFALSFDHRIVDGSDADRFMAHVKKGLQEFDEAAL